MEEWLTRRLNKAADEAAAMATAKATAETLVSAIDALVKKQGLSMEDACDTLDYTIEDYLSAKKLLSDVAIVV